MGKNKIRSTIEVVHGLIFYAIYLFAKLRFYEKYIA